MSDVFTLTVWDCLKYLYAFLYDWFDYTIHWNPRLRELAWEGIQAWARMAFTKVFEEIEAKANDAVTIVEDWATGIIGTLEKGADNIVTQLTNLWGTTASLWDQFGPTISSTVTTVEQWVAGAVDDVEDWVTEKYKGVVTEVNAFYAWLVAWGNDVATWFSDNAADITAWFDEKATTITTWIEDNSATVWTWIKDNSATVWNWIRDRSGEVWDWIRDHASDFSDWLTGTGTPMETLYDKVKAWLEDLYDEHRSLLASFLGAPGVFIADYMLEWLEGTEDKPGPVWFAFLIKLFNDPIGTLWAYLDAAGQFINAWIEYELVKRTPSWESLAASIRAIDSLIPDEEEFVKGLFEPTTPEEIEDYEQVDRVIAWVIEGTLDQHPFQFPALPPYRGGRYLEGA